MNRVDRGWWEAHLHFLSWREVDFAGVVVAGLIGGYVMALAGLWAGRVPGLVAVDIVPQAWAAAVPILAVQLLLGLLPDAPSGRCYLQPCLPDWLPLLQVSGIRLAGDDLEVRIRRDGDRTVLEHAHHPTLEIQQAAPPAPLWGAPM